MRVQSFINFLREDEGKVDRQKVLSLSALVGSSVLAQLIFAGVSHSFHCPDVPCGTPCGNTCTFMGCDPAMIMADCVD